MATRTICTSNWLFPSSAGFTNLSCRAKRQIYRRHLTQMIPHWTKLSKSTYFTVDISENSLFWGRSFSVFWFDKHIPIIVNMVFSPMQMLYVFWIISCALSGKSMCLILAHVSFFGRKVSVIFKSSECNENQIYFYMLINILAWCCSSKHILYSIL